MNSMTDYPAFIADLASVSFYWRGYWFNCPAVEGEGCVATAMKVVSTLSGCDRINALPPERDSQNFVVGDEDIKMRRYVLELWKSAEATTRGASELFIPICLASSIIDKAAQRYEDMGPWKNSVSNSWFVLCRNEHGIPEVELYDCSDNLEIAHDIFSDAALPELAHSPFSPESRT